MCSACNKIIPAFEMVMRVHGDRWNVFNVANAIIDSVLVIDSIFMIIEFFVNMITKKCLCLPMMVPVVMEVLIHYSVMEDE
ncbi:hypothetical protein BLA29_005401 [Euroglyphus maynei]|uniref:Uncharacterized protein n=1 Tax=Euroglyphus maynei TaxID=6958 RepID=A0A1Y3AUL6_EURMA|nr:hypothetical protein BLA29_005401 [Euroglyphus maynei]